MSSIHRIPNEVPSFSTMSRVTTADGAGYQEKFTQRNDSRTWKYVNPKQGDTYKVSVRNEQVEVKRTSSKGEITQLALNEAAANQVNLLLDQLSQLPFLQRDDFCTFFNDCFGSFFDNPSEKVPTQQQKLGNKSEEKRTQVRQELLDIVLSALSQEKQVKAKDPKDPIQTEPPVDNKEVTATTV